VVILADLLPAAVLSEKPIKLLLGAAMTKVYKHWKDFPMSQWRWPSFTPQELASKGEGELLIDEPSLDKLQTLRNMLGKPLIVTSAYRSHAHNKSQGGAPNSQHRLGKAYDIIQTNHNPQEFIAAARQVGFRGIGQYPKSNFVHIDTGPARVWNDGSNFPSAAKSQAATPTFPTEPKVDTVKDILTKPETLASGAALVTAGGAVAQGNGPVQMALGFAVVVAVLGLVIWLVLRALKAPREV
jgi:zinc D-Ala-D-Ala carboxypeptidase